MSAEPKPEKPRTAPARTAAPTAAANDAERTSRVVPPAWITARHDPWAPPRPAPLGARRGGPGGGAGGGRGVAWGRGPAAAGGGAAPGGADAARALDAVGVAVEPAALGVR